jgi:hypothetical protein
MKLMSIYSSSGGNNNGQLSNNSGQQVGLPDFSILNPQQTSLLRKHVKLQPLN